MIKRAFFALPGPMAVKVVLAFIIVVVGLIALNFVYDWMGNFLDAGGNVG
jgi:hypothetical protein